jgi:hypothetical protein
MICSSSTTKSSFYIEFIPSKLFVYVTVLIILNLLTKILN